MKTDITSRWLHSGGNMGGCCIVQKLNQVVGYENADLYQLHRRCTTFRLKHPIAVNLLTVTQPTLRSFIKLHGF